jgi:hypothetical protein
LINLGILPCILLFRQEKLFLVNSLLGRVSVSFKIGYRCFILLMSKEEVSTCFLADIVVVLLYLEHINCAYPIVRKNDAKTILNKFVCKGLNAIFVKLCFFFEVSNLFFCQNNQIKILTALVFYLK